MITAGHESRLSLPSFNSAQGDAKVNRGKINKSKRPRSNERKTKIETITAIINKKHQRSRSHFNEKKQDKLLVVYAETNNSPT